ncbi:MAG: hypothetical protein F9K48_10835, partial [Candidatus Brocadia sp.]
MKFCRILLQATSLIGVLVIILCVGYNEIICAETQEKAAQTIKKIEIRGVQRISPTAIKSSIRVKEGDRYNPLTVSQDVDAIWSLGFFDNIEVELEELRDGLKLIFVVTERAVID